MPTIQQLPAATSVAATDLLPLSQGGTTKALSVGNLLSSVQPALSLAPSKLLGRVSTTAGGPEVVAIGTGLTIATGAVAATGADHTQLPISLRLQAGDEVVVNTGGQPKRMQASLLRSLFVAGAGISIDGTGTIVATGGSGAAGVSTFNARSGTITLTGADVSAAGGALATSLPTPATIVPFVDGAAAIGTSPLYARQDHVHPNDSTRLGVMNNLSDVANAGAARTNLGLGGAAALNVGSVTGTVAAGDDARITGAQPAATIGAAAIMAAGATSPRTLAARAADVVWLHDFLNADGTAVDAMGVVDATYAFQAAIATGRNVRVRAGNYKIKRQLTLGVGQWLLGEDRTTTVLQIGPDFSSTATAVIAGPGTETGPGLKDIGISFYQPLNVANRGAFVTLAAAGGSTTVGIMYPPAVDFREASRFVIDGLRVSGAWIGVDARGNTGGAWLRRVEIGALSVGLAIDGAEDFFHIDGLHLFPFGIPGTYTDPVHGIGTPGTCVAVYQDGNTFGIDCGRCDGLNWSDINTFGPRIRLRSQTYNISTGGPGTPIGNIRGLNLEGSFGTFEFGAGNVCVTNGYSTKGQGATVSPFTISGGLLNASNFQFIGSSETYTVTVGGVATTYQGVPSLNQTGGLATLTGCRFEPPVGSGQPVAAVSGGTLMVRDAYIHCGSAARAAACFVQTGGALDLDGCKFDAGSNVAVSCATDIAANRISVNNDFGGNTVVGPSGATLGLYNTLPATTIMDAGGDTGALTIAASADSAGANIRLVGNGTTTPNKTLRVINGQFQLLNSAYSAAILSVDDAGDTSITGALSVETGISGQSVAAAASIGSVTGYGISVFPSLGVTEYNPMVGAGDTALVFGIGDQGNAHHLTLTAHAATSGGVRIGNDGSVALWGSVQVPSGSATSPGMQIGPAGTGVYGASAELGLLVGGNEGLRVSTFVSGARFAMGGGPGTVHLTAEGTTTDVGIDIAAQGTGTINLGSPVTIGGVAIGALYAPLAGPGFTGVPTAPTAVAGTSTTQLATTAFVASAISSAPPGNTGNVVTSGISYQMASTDRFLVIRKTVGSSTNVTLPTSPLNWVSYVVKDGKGDASVNNVTIQGTTIDGRSSFVVSVNYGAATFVFDGAEWSAI